MARKRAKRTARKRTRRTRKPATVTSKSGRKYKRVGKKWVHVKAYNRKGPAKKRRTARRRRRR